MGYRTHRRFPILGILITLFHINNGCQLDGISTAPIPIILTILDTYTGAVVNTTTSNIVEITGVEHGGNLNHGPYLEVSHSDSRFLLRTNDLYAQYEEHETLQMITITVNFRCTGSETLTRVFWVNVEDTNNNAPVFIPTDQLEFTIATPVPPGFEVTGCLDGITVRDIDLTTQRIDFSIEENPYFEIMYDASISTTPKEFKAILRTTTFIRTLTEPMTLRISATDVDLTNDPPLTTYATVRILSNTDFELPPEPVFSQTFYLANYTESNTLVHEPIYLQQGFDDAVEFTLEGDYKNYFQLVTNGTQISIRVVTPLPDNVMLENQIFLIVRADRTYTSGGSSTIIVRLPDVIPLEFERAHYTGVIVDNTLQLQELRLSQGYEGRVTVSITSDHTTNFNAAIQGNVITITMSPLNESVILANNFINLQVTASTDHSSASAIVTLEIIKDDVFTPAFDRALYTGSYDPTTNLLMEPITIVNGFDDTVVLNLEGDYRSFFQIVQEGPNIHLTASTLPPEIYSEQHILLTIRASKPRTVGASAAIVISLPEDTEIELSASFDRVLYEGVIQNNNVIHENIIVSDFNGTSVDIYGEYAELFRSHVVEGAVVVQAVVWADAHHVSHVPLELRADAARAVLLLTVVHSDVQIDTEVTFSSPTYSVNVDNARTGLIGRVVATADPGEPIRYTITSNDHLNERLSINGNGELFLSAPAEIGNYTALVTATTILTLTRAQATIYLSVIEAITSSEGNLPPLIIIDRDEEVPHRNLVVLNDTQHPGCTYSLANRWPVNQTWLYVDEEGLHTRAIDREHESIALMALSQVQVELTLHCGYENVRNKRSLTARPDWLGPYDYGTKEWVLTNSIPYNPRRTVVNLVVNDINDNHPIFIGKEHEPIAVGYPVDELVERVMPRSLAELQATDADVGINAAVVYWSTEEAISVARTTGFIHVRDGASIEDSTRLVVHATDRNGEGLSGSIEILVKLLNIENIVVLTIRDAFLDDERNILTNLSSVVGYDVKVLRSTVMPDGAQANQDDSSRKRRNAQATGSSLQLYIYGMIEREPVTVDRLTSDINNNAIVAVTVASVVSLQDYLEGREICVIPGRDTGLLVATILLSILLFILIVLIAVWFIIKRRKETNYDQFSDQNSIASRNESLGAQPKPVNPPKPRLNVDELKKSERRLQDMLQAPVLEARPTTSKKEPQQESILDMPPPDSPAPTVTVIQSIDKLKDATDESDTDEFGEVDTTRRKSVVTFNENVEKIIHVEDSADEGSHPGYEIYKL